MWDVSGIIKGRSNKEFKFDLRPISKQKNNLTGKLGYTNTKAEKMVFEFKSAIREEATIHTAYDQLIIRYKRDIPELFKYNTFCVISDGVNNKAGSFYAPYEFYYAWRKTDGSDLVEKDGIDSLYTMIKGVFNQERLCDIIHNFSLFPF